MNHQKKLDTVIAVIKEFPEAANNDSILLEKYWLKEGWDESKSLYWNLSRVTRPETVSRRRREAFNLGLIEYSPEAFKARKKAYERERDVHSYFEDTKAEIVNKLNLKNRTVVKFVNGEWQTIEDRINTLNKGIKGE
jgi:hypothetical protein